jgi:hypothetical protein
MTARRQLWAAGPALTELRTDFQAGLAKVTEILVAQQQQLDELARSPEPAPVVPAEPAVYRTGDHLPPRWKPEAEDVVRFVSPHRFLGLWMSTPHVVVVDGKKHVDAGRKLEFVNGIYDTSDPEEITFLRQHEGFGRRFVEDPHASPLPGPKVMEGPRQSKPSARDGQPAGGLSARLDG